MRKILIVLFILSIANPMFSANTYTRVVSSKSGWHVFHFAKPVQYIVAIFGGWSVDKKNYTKVGPHGHFGSSARRLAPYSHYKFDTRLPFGALLLKIPGRGHRWVNGPLKLERRTTVIWLRINDRAFVDNQGTLNVSFE